MASRGFIAGVLPNSPENMVRWLRQPQSVDPRSAMPDLGVSERDARDIAAYLSSLK
jgi:cytochrome c1